MGTREVVDKLRSVLKAWSRPARAVPVLPAVEPSRPKIGLALGGGFARGVAHVGVLNVLARERIPLHCITGVSAGAIVAAAYASGTALEDITKVACAMRFADVARWSICRLGLLKTERMAEFLKRLLKRYHFEEMLVPLGVLATDVGTGEPVLFRDTGDVILPIRASCAYPGLFQPIRQHGRLLVDGAMCVEVPALLARKMGATRVISVGLPMQSPAVEPSNMLQVVNRCYQILQSRSEDTWRRHSDLVITPDVAGIEWDGFKRATAMIQAGEQAAEAALPAIWEWLKREQAGTAALEPAAVEQLAS